MRRVGVFKKLTKKTKLSAQKSEISNLWEVDVFWMDKLPRCHTFLDSKFQQVSRKDQFNRGKACGFEKSQQYTSITSFENVCSWNGTTEQIKTAPNDSTTKSAAFKNKGSKVRVNDIRDSSGLRFRFCAKTWDKFSLSSFCHQCNESGRLKLDW